MSNVATSTLNVLSLCAGVGMLDIAVGLACDARTVCYVEREAYAAGILAARMADKAIDEAPVWSDLVTFDGAAWRGTVDCITGGFPCQPHSAAGKRKGLDDERWLWDDIARIIRDVEPWLVYLENVPGLINTGGLAACLASLSEMGFAAEWGCVSAASVGASHKRERIFILAVKPGRGWGKLQQPSWCDGLADGGGKLVDALGHTGHDAGNAKHREQPESATSGAWKSGSDRYGKQLAVANSDIVCTDSGSAIAIADRGHDAGGCRGEVMADTESGRGGLGERLQQQGRAEIEGASDVVDNPTSARCDGAGIGTGADSGSGECVLGEGCNDVADAGRDGVRRGTRRSEADGGWPCAEIAGSDALMANTNDYQPNQRQGTESSTLERPPEGRAELRVGGHSEFVANTSSPRPQGSEQRGARNADRGGASIWIS